MKAAVYDKRSQKPILIVEEKDGQISPVEGDAKLFEKLKMNKGSLKRLAEYLEGTDTLVLQPISEGDISQQKEQAEQKESDQSNLSRDEKISEAVKVLKKLLSMAQKRQEGAKADKEKRDKAVYEKQDAEVVMPQGEIVYVSLDGDHIGNAVMRAEEADDEEALKDVSRRIDAGQNLMRQWARQMGGQVIQAGGDEGLLKVPKQALDSLSDLRRQYHSVVGATATVGVGSTIRESTKARMLGKLRGRNRVVMWEGEEMERELEHRVNAEDQDCKDRLKVLMQRCEPQEAEQAKKESEQLEPDTKKSLMKGLPDLSFFDKSSVYDLSKAEPVVELGDRQEGPEEKIPSWAIEEANKQGVDPKFFWAFLENFKR